MAMLDQDLKEFLNAKFDSIIEKIDGTKEDIERHTKEIQKLDESSTEMTKQLIKLEAFQETHTQDHDNSKTSKNFNIGVWVLIIIFVAGQIIDLFR